MVLVDTHAHLYLPHFSDDIGQVINNARDNRVLKILLPNIDTESVSPMLDLCARFPDRCYPMIGLHPTSVDGNYKKKLSFLESMAANGTYTAIGETGTDAHWDTDFLKEQEDSFITHLQWAKKMDLPVVIHARKTMDSLIRIIKTHKNDNLRGVFHAFSGTPRQAREILNLGFKLGIGGVVTYKNSGLTPVLESVGLDDLVLETDSPYLSPVPKRGKRNESAHILLIAEKIAEIKETTVEEVALKTSDNAARLFNLDLDQ